MKKIFFVALLYTYASALGQIEYSDSLHHVTVGGYAGILAYPAISIKTGKVKAFATARLGGTVNYSPKPFISLFGLGAIEINEAAVVDPFFLLGVKLVPHKKVVIALGKIATPMTELRPLPTTGAGQFETWTEARIPGSGFGGKITYNASERFSVVAGSFWRSTDASVELGIKIPHTQFAGYYMVTAKTFGMAMTFNYKLFTAVIAYNHRKVVTMFDCIEIPKTHGLVITSDVGFDPTSGKLLRGEWGAFKTIETKFVRVLVGVGYDQVLHSFKPYVFIYTQR